MAASERIYFQPARDYLFEVIIEGILPLYVQSGSFPYSAMETYSQLNANSFGYYPGANDVSAPEITFVEDEDTHVFAFFQKWFEMVMDENGYYNIPSTYKKGILVKRINTDQQPSGWSLNYEGCWPKSISAYNPSHKNTSALEFTVTFSADGVKSLGAS